MARVLIGNIKGVPGDDYVLTAEDKSEIAEAAAELVDVGGKVDKAGGSMTGTLVASYSSEGGQVRNVFIVTSEPSASVGKDGDIAFVIGG